jgi:hypothetical protein
VQAFSAPPDATFKSDYASADGDNLKCFVDQREEPEIDEVEYHFCPTPDANLSEKPELLRLRA